MTVLVGENNGGKSNIVDAIRLLTLPLSGRRERYAEDEDLRRGSPVLVSKEARLDPSAERVGRRNSSSADASTTITRVRAPRGSLWRPASSASRASGCGFWSASRGVWAALPDVRVRPGGNRRASVRSQPPGPSTCGAARPARSWFRRPPGPARCDTWRAPADMSVPHSNTCWSIALARPPSTLTPVTGTPAAFMRHA